MSLDLTSIQSQFNINTANSNAGDIYEFENFRLNASTLMLYCDEEAVPLAPKVVETLLALIERRGEIVSKREMMNRLWADSFVADANLTQNIYLLRKTLGKGTDGRDLIETFRRRGYRFTGKIQHSPAETSDAVKPLNSLPETVSREESERANIFDSLAVLPLVNESDDENAEYLSDGITESIINRLSQVEDFRVVARSTVFRYKNSEIDFEKIRRDLNVSAILSGRVLQLGEKLIVRCELVDAANGWQIWGEQYDRASKDVLGLQETIAREVSEQLHLKLSGEEKKRLAKRDTKSSEAYGFYVKGRYFLNKRLRETIEQATVFFQNAIDVDSRYALAYVGLADCFPLLSLYGALSPREAYPKAEASARKALEIDANLAEAYNSLGVVKLFYEWDWAGAEKAFQKAVALNPNYADARQRYGIFLTAQNRFDEAVAQFDIARLHDPLSLITHTISGYPFYYSRQFEKAAERFGEVIAADDSYSMAHFRLGLTYAQIGEFEKALAELGTATVLSNDRDVVAALGYVYASQGNAEKARAALDELAEREEKGFVSAYDKAIVYAGMQNTEAALDFLEKAFEEHSYWLIYLQNDPIFDHLRENPRFQDLQEKIFGENVPAEDFSGNNPTVQTKSSGEKAARTNYFALAAVFLILLATIFGGIYLFISKSQKPQEQVSAPPEIKIKRLTPDLNIAAAALSSDGKYLVYVQRENEKRSIWLKDIATGGAKQIMPPDEAYGEVEFSPDGSQLYFKTTQNNRMIIARVPFTGGTPQKIAEDVTSPFTISPDGKQVAFVREQSLIIANADGSGERILSRRDVKNDWFESWESQLSWSPDGNSIAICGGRTENGKSRYTLTEISIANASERQIPVPDWEYLDDVKWIPDGSGLIVIARETSGAPFQIWRIVYPSGAATRITQDFQEYKSISISADSRLLVATPVIGNRNIWISPAADARQAKQITFGTAANDGFWGVAQMPDGRIVYTSPRSGNWDLWIMNSDGSNQKQLTSNAGENQKPVNTPDGRYIFFQSDRNNGAWRIWRMDADGGNLKQITDGEGFQYRPIAAPDGQWIYFTWADGMKSTIWKIPVEGGEPVRISPAESIGLHSASPDGKLLCIEKYEKDAPLQWQQGIMRADTGEVIRWIDQYLAGQIRWTTDSKSLIFIESPKYLNLWQLPVDGGVPKQITNFDAQQLRAFDISADGKTIVMSRGNSSIEAVLITNFR